MKDCRATMQMTSGVVWGKKRENLCKYSVLIINVSIFSFIFILMLVVFYILKLFYS